MDTIETKMDGNANMADLAATFEAFKQTNDQRLAEIEKKGAADPLVDDRLRRIDRQLESLSLKAVRPEQGQPMPVARSEANEAWQSYLRRGDESGLARLDLKSLNTGTDSQGGYVAPEELDRLIESRLHNASPMRQIASVRQTSSGVFKKPVSLGATAAWTSEMSARVQTTAPDLSLLEFPAGELYAMPAATQTLLEDSYVDIDAWLADEVETAFAAQESDAFVNGDGNGKPKGFLNYSQVDNANHAWDSIGTVVGDLSAADAVDGLIDLIHAPKSQYRANARFAMNRSTLSAVRKLKDTDGRYIWQPGDAQGAGLVMGYGITELEDMPDATSGNAAIAFGDFRRFYLITDRQGARVLRDPFSSKPYVLFYTTKRVGGGVQNFDAVKLMVF